MVVDDSSGSVAAVAGGALGAAHRPPKKAHKQPQGRDRRGTMAVLGLYFCDSCWRRNVLGLLSIYSRRPKPKDLRASPRQS